MFGEPFHLFQGFLADQLQLLPVFGNELRLGKLVSQSVAFLYVALIENVFSEILDLA